MYIPGRLLSQAAWMGGMQSIVGGRFRIDNLSGHTVMLNKIRVEAVPGRCAAFKRAD
jgi:hypothetical protein